MLRASPNQNLINFQLECNMNVKETAQSQPKPESHQFSIRMELQCQGNCSGPAKARISSIFNQNVIGISRNCSGPAQARISSIFNQNVIQILRKMLRASPNQILSIFNQNVIGISRKMLRASRSQNLINFHLECNRNFKETAKGQPKPESYQFSRRM